MSHFSTVKTELRDREALVGALGDIGYSPAPAGQIRGYRGQTVTADLTIPQPEGPDIGFRLNPESGSYELVADLDLWKLSTPLERFLAQLTQRYALRTILAVSLEEGFQVSEQTQELDGSIELVVSRWDA